MPRHESALVIAVIRYYPSSSWLMQLRGDMFCLQPVTWLVWLWQPSKESHPLLKHSHGCRDQYHDTILVFKLSLKTSLSGAMSFVSLPDIVTVTARCVEVQLFMLYRCLSVLICHLCCLFSPTERRKQKSSVMTSCR